jgi:ADP-ribose pyrophosphatase YjhB (NUDIX family)
MKKSMFCNNCGKLGHLFHQCKIPITSYGIICFRYVNNIHELLLVRRKDSLGFVDFMRGKYSLDDIDYIINIFNIMTINEKKWIQTKTFDMLWSYLWGGNIASHYRNEEKNSRDKFEILKMGYLVDNILINFEYIINNSTNNYPEPEWGFPKGRRNFQENDITCALREFNEETGYNKNNILIINNILPFDEIFTGTNYKSYKHKYFLGYMNNLSEPLDPFQINEIYKIEWVDINKVSDRFRDYNFEKKNIINQIINLLNNYKIYY